MAQAKLNWRMNLVIFGVFVVLGLIWLFLGSPAQRSRENEESACRDACAKLDRASRLIPAIPAGSVPQGKYDGPWNCECY